MSQVGNKIDTNLIAGNIKTGASIYGVNGTFAGGIPLTGRTDLNVSVIWNFINNHHLYYRKIGNLYFIAGGLQNLTARPFGGNTLQRVSDSATALATLLGGTLKGYTNNNLLLISSHYYYHTGTQWTAGSGTTYYIITAVELN